MPTAPKNVCSFGNTGAVEALGDRCAPEAMPIRAELAKQLLWSDMLLVSDELGKAGLDQKWVQRNRAATCCGLHPAWVLLRFGLRRALAAARMPARAVYKFADLGLYTLGVFLQCLAPPPQHVRSRNPGISLKFDDAQVLSVRRSC
jgi:hypothetical protein